MKKTSLVIKWAMAAGLALLPLPLYAVHVSVTSAEEIQTAIDAAAAAGGGTVSLASGTYILSASIEMKSNVTLEGAGTSTRLELPEDAVYAMITDDGTEPCVNMTIRNLLLDGNIPESAVSHDPDYDDPQGSCLGIYFDAYTEATYHTNVVIENVEIHNTVDACHLKGVNGGYMENVYFHHNGIFYWPGHNSYLRRVQNYVVRHSRFEDSYNGSGINCSWSENLAFTNCTVSRSGGRGIRNAASDGFVVQDCVIEDCGTAGIIANSESGITTSNINFSGNYVTGCGDDGITGGASGVAADNNSFGNDGDNYSLGSSVAQSGNISDAEELYHVGSPSAIPGLIEAEEYDAGGSGTAYYDTTTGNAGGEYRSDDVDITTCSEGGYALTALDDGEWLRYAVGVLDTGQYSFDVRYAADEDGAIRLALGERDLTGDVILPATGGSDTWASERVAQGIILEPGIYSLYVHISGTYQLNSLTVNLDETGTGEESAVQYIEAESYDDASGIRVESCGDTGGGTNVSYISNGDWCRYNDLTPGTNTTFNARVARPSGKSDSTIEVRLGSTTGTLIGSVAVPYTGGWQTYVTVSTALDTVAGQQDVYLVFVEDGTTGASLCNLNWFELETPAASQAAAVPTGLAAAPESASQISLSWDAQSGISAFNLKRSTSSGGPYETMILGPTRTNYVDSGLLAGTNYYYVMSAVLDGEESADTAEVTAVPTARPDAPQNLYAWPDSNKVVTVRWDADASAVSGFNLYRSTNDADFVLIASGIMNHEYVDSDVAVGVTYTYKAAGVNSVGEGGLSDTETAVPTPYFIMGSEAEDVTESKYELFDGDLDTIFDRNASGYAGVDFGEGNEQVFSAIRYFLRNDAWGNYDGGTRSIIRSVGFTFEGANSEDFSDAVIIHTLTTDSVMGAWNEVAVTNTAPFRYIRLQSGGDYNRMYTMAELEFESTAAFTAHGTPYSWLAQYGLDESDEMLDTDQDGLLTWEEYAAGTIPNDPDSVLKVIAAQGSSSNGFVITWQSVAGQSYSIMTNTGLVSPDWGVAVSGITGLESETSHTTTVSGAGTVFFNIAVE